MYFKQCLTDCTLFLPAWICNDILGIVDTAGRFVSNCLSGKDEEENHGTI